MSRLILCGAGHVSYSLARIGALLEFEVFILDDRAEFANADRFPMAAGIFALPFLEGLKRLGNRPDDFFCILTRGHAWDRDCLAEILQREFAYVGMIGSQTKIAATKQALMEQGFSVDQLAQVHAPIGLLLGGQTPAEIAVEIAAELVQVRRALGLPQTPPPTGAGVLCTIIEKKGSAPQGPGAWLFVSADGKISGTLGGGQVEYEIVEAARAIWNGAKLPLEQGFSLENGASGMICGGQILVRFTRQS